MPPLVGTKREVDALASYPFACAQTINPGRNGAIKSGWRGSARTVNPCNPLRQQATELTSQAISAFRDFRYLRVFLVLLVVLKEPPLRKVTRLTAQKYAVSGRLKRLMAFSAFIIAGNP